MASPPVRDRTAATGAGLLNAKWAWLNVTTELIADYWKLRRMHKLRCWPLVRRTRFPRQFIEELMTALRSK